MSEAIRIENLTFGYTSKKKVLKNLNLTINKGEYVTILGHNGSGKSTLAKLLVGLLEKESGLIYINDLELNEENIDKIRQEIGIVFQNPDNQFFGITVKDDIAFGLENRCYSPKDMEKLVLDYAKKVKMEEFLDRNPEELSGGQKQRVAIAGVMAFEPNIIIFDEATSMLDPNGAKEVIDTIKSLHNKKTILSITHNLNEAIDSDRVIVLNKGKVVLNGTPKEVFKEKEILKEASLDITISMKLIELIEKSNMKRASEVEDVLWQLTFQK